MYPFSTKKTYTNFREWVLGYNYPDGPSQQQIEKIIETDEQYNYNETQFYDVIESTDSTHEDSTNVECADNMDQDHSI